MSGAADNGPRRDGHNGRVPVTDLSSYPLRLSRRPAPTVGLRSVAVAVETATWPGVVLPPAEILGGVVYPVVEFADVRERLSTFVGPQRCPTTLQIWEAWPEMGYGAPLRIVGFVAAIDRWGAAVTAASRTRGLGAGMIYAQHRPSDLDLLDADASGLWVLGGEPTELLVAGRSGPVPSATRTLTTRVMEERLFAHALKAGMVPAG